MQRVTVSLDEGLAQSFDELLREQGYQSRSEAVRDLVREAVEARRLASEEGGHCVASLSYVYDHHVRDLAQRLTAIQHQHHDLVIATTHVHLDHEVCLEATLLKGPTSAVRALADGIRSERGVKFGEINLVSVTPNHEHPGSGHHDHGAHLHLSPHRG